MRVDRASADPDISGRQKQPDVFPYNLQVCLDGHSSTVKESDHQQAQKQQTTKSEIALRRACQESEAGCTGYTNSRTNQDFQH
jgi:hypothetical protein